MMVEDERKNMVEIHQQKSKYPSLGDKVSFASSNTSNCYEIVLRE
jgi:hypothetical protein